MRINITGNAGAGKTRLAQHVACWLGIPVFHLDSLVWQPGWGKAPTRTRRSLEQQLVSKRAWVIDGVSATVRQAADIVVYLDVPRNVCLLRALMRTLHYGLCTRPEMPPGCPELLALPKLIRIIYCFPGKAGATLVAEAQRQPEKFRIVQHPVDATAVVKMLQAVRS